MGIMGGYCVSGVKDDDEDTGRVYDQCKDGIGKYDPSSTTQYMDVYHITSSTGENPAIQQESELLNSGDAMSLQGTSGVSPTIGLAIVCVNIISLHVAALLALILN